MTTRYVYLCAEGRGDKGSLGDPMASGSSDEGVFQPLLRRALEGHHIEFRPGFEGLSLGADVPTSVKGKHADFALKARVIAETYEWDLVVIHVDADDRVRKKGKAPSGFTDRRDALLEGAGSGAAGGHGHVPVVAAVPVRMAESWLLGDLEAVKLCCPSGKLSGTTPDKIMRPEELGGSPKDPTSDYPKAVLARLLGEDATSDLQARIAEKLDLALVRRRCPVSFERFMLDLETATAHW